MAIKTVNPATNKLIKCYDEMSENTISDIIDQSSQAFLTWRCTSFSKRKQSMLQAAALLKQHKNRYADIICTEMGKPITQAYAEIEKCTAVCQYYAKNAENWLKPRVISTEMKTSQVVYRPLGIVLAIMPWNFPFWQVFRFAAPNLMAGNATLLRHASIVTGASLAIETLFKEAGFPENVFRSLVINKDRAAFVIKHPKVAAVTLTGSECAGSMVGAQAASSLKKVILELGGSDPYLILEDADLKRAAQACITSRMNNTGQVCISAKRLIIVDSIYDSFELLILEQIKHYTMGDPTNKETQLGPLAHEALRNTVHKQVQDSIKQGATLLTGGKIPDRVGFYYPPTVLANVKKGMPAYHEEIFGPVVSLLRVKDEAEAITVANDSRFGLAAAVFTKDESRGLDIAMNKIQAGTCYVNEYVASDPRLPFGGIKSSGYGRELSIEGIHEFVNTKTICVAN